MEIIWLGHACFVLESDGCRAVLDPYSFECYPPLSIEAHEVFCSHGHRDHNYTDGVRLLAPRKSAFTVTKIETFHDDAQGTLRGMNTMHLLEAEGLRVLHCGDLGHPLDAAQLAQVGRCDALLIPVGGYYTIDAKAAKTLTDALGARVVVPMHYRHGEYGLREVGGVEDFLALYDADEVTHLSQNRFTLTHETPHGVVVPQYKGASL